LPGSLEQIRIRPAEVIVVDDCSTDDSVAVAIRLGANVLSTCRKSGPARARNLGAQAAFGEILLFLDADVCVHTDTIPKVVAEFLRYPGLDAVMGSYDRKPSAIGYLSVFRNLMHHFVHQIANREATTFWAGCGAVRRTVFQEFGGFSEKYKSPSIEDIELGYRMAHAGRKLALNVDIQVTHRKEWSFHGMLQTDFFYRALPWSELSILSGRMPNDLNLRITQRISVFLVVLLFAMAGYLTVLSRAHFLTPLLATLFMLLSEYWIQSAASESKRARIPMVSALALIIGLSYLFQMFAIIPIVLAAWLAMFMRHRYAYSSEVWHRRTGALVAAYLLLVIASVWYYLPWHPMALLFLLVLLTLLILNKQFYMFLAADRGKLFALAAIPFHLLYFAASGLAFMVAVIRLGLIRPFRLPQIARRAVPKAH
jgi:glycosyltransferase involved in cell wall biosynthesis